MHAKCKSLILPLLVVFVNQLKTENQGLIPENTISNDISCLIKTFIENSFHISFAQMVYGLSLHTKQSMLFLCMIIFGFSFPGN